MNRKIVIIAAAVFYAQLPMQAAPVSFQQAQADYNAGKYAQALAGFEPYAAKYPGNPLVRYYVGLCHLALKHNPQARQEFQFVSTCSDAKLASQAKTGLAQLDRLSGSIASAAPAANAPAGDTKPAPQAASKVKGKLKKVIEFYADW